MKKILVTGGAGYVGTELVKILINKGFEVVVIDNLSYNQKVFSDLLKNKRFRFIKGDIREEEDIKKALKDIDFIVHLAAIVGAPACDEKPALAVKVNVHGTQVINKFRRNIPILYASTGSIYGKVDGTCNEESPVNPLSLYGKTKYQAEKIVEKTGNYIVYRPATAFGVSERMRTDLLINDFVNKALETNNLSLFEAHAKRTFIHVRDYARAIVFAIDNFEKMKNQVYNIGDEKMNLTKKQIAEIIKKQIKCKIEILKNGSDPDKRDYEVSYKKIKSLGFSAEITIQQGIEELIKYYKRIK